MSLYILYIIYPEILKMVFNLLIIHKSTSIKIIWGCRDGKLVKTIATRYCHYYSAVIVNDHNNIM